MKKYDFCFSCGFSCGVTLALREAKLQFSSFPFDWTATPSFIRAARAVESDFSGWLERDDLELIDVKHSGINKRIYENRRTGFGFVHDFSLFQTPEESYEEVSRKYRRRAARLGECLRSARKVLAVCAEWPFLGPLKKETLEEIKRIFEMKFPGVEFDLLYFHVSPGEDSASVEYDSDGVTMVGCEYRKYLPGGVLHHEIDNSRIVEYLKGNVECEDPRSGAERAKYDAERNQSHKGRWKGSGALDALMNRIAFRQYRRLERYLSKKGFFPPERPLRFVDLNEPR